MPRAPRKCYDTSFFHIIVQGINKEYIFKSENYIKKYLNLLNKYKEETKIEIIAYCIMNNHAHILLYTNTIDEMSQYMQKVNTQYAKYYNYKENGRVGYVFRDRYISEPIKHEKYLIRCINYIHSNPVKAGMVMKQEDYQYSSYNDYINGKKLRMLSEILGVKYDVEILKHTVEIDVFKDIDNNSKEVIETIMIESLKISNFKREEIIKDNIILSILINKLKNIYELKYTEIMKVLNITRGRMEKLRGR